MNRETGGDNELSLPDMAGEACLQPAIAKTEWAN
jgi:hypothetical protein